MADVEQVEVPLAKGMTEGQALAAVRLQPVLRHGTIANSLAAVTVKFDGKGASANDASEMLQRMANQVASGDLRPVSDTLFAQSVMLDATVTELMTRAWKNAGDYPDAFHRYMNLALKAQAQSRASLEALARMHQPREQIVRHINVNEGGQAIVADQLTIGGPGGGNAAIADQSHTARAIGAEKRAALPSPDPLGNGVPIASGTGEAQMQNARRDQPRRASRQQQRAKARTSNSGDASSS